MNKQLIASGTVVLLFGLTTTSIICVNVIAFPGTIDVESPYHGSSYFEGEIISITWSYSNDSGDWAKIDLYYDGYFYSTISKHSVYETNY